MIRGRWIPLKIQYFGNINEWMNFYDYRLHLNFPFSLSLSVVFGVWIHSNRTRYGIRWQTIRKHFVWNRTRKSYRMWRTMVIWKRKPLWKSSERWQRSAIIEVIWLTVPLDFVWMFYILFLLSLTFVPFHRVAQVILHLHAHRALKYDEDDEKKNKNDEAKEIHNQHKIFTKTKDFVFLTKRDLALFLYFVFLFLFLECVWRARIRHIRFLLLFSTYYMHFVFHSWCDKLFCIFFAFSAN